MSPNPNPNPNPNLNPRDADVVLEILQEARKGGDTKQGREEGDGSSGECDCIM